MVYNSIKNKRLSFGERLILMLFFEFLFRFFMSGAVFLFTVHKFFGVKFSLTISKVALSVSLSLIFNLIIKGVNYGYIGLNQHIWFDLISMAVFSVLSACLISALLLFLPQRVLRKIFYRKRITFKAKGSANFNKKKAA